MPVAIAFTVIGLAAIVYSVYTHHKPTTNTKAPIWVSLVLITWLGIGYDYYDRHSHEVFEDKPAQTVVSRQTFQNQEVQLDGVKYAGCTFKNVTFVYNATRPYELINNQFIGVNRLTTNSKQVSATVGLIYGLGMIRPGLSMDFPAIIPSN